MSDGPNTGVSVHRHKFNNLKFADDIDTFQLQKSQKRINEAVYVDLVGEMHPPTLLN